MITGGDLIIYILENHLEDEPIAKDGRFIGYLSMELFAQEMNVGVGTVKAWIKMSVISDAIPIGDTYLIPEIYLRKPKGEND